MHRAVQRPGVGFARGARLLALAVLLGAGGAVAQEDPIPGTSSWYEAREANAADNIAQLLADAREEIQRRHLDYQVGYTTRLGSPTPGPASLEMSPAVRSRLPAHRGITRELIALRPLAPPWLSDCRSASAVDLVELGAVQPVVGNQGGCASCWAFACLVPFESSYFRRTGVMPNVSEQDLVNCMNWDCGGGNHPQAWARMMQRGAAREADVPYSGDAYGACGTPDRPYRVLAWDFCGADPRYPERDDIKRDFCRHGPITTFIYVDGNFDIYSGGVYDVTRPIGNSYSHAVAIVGWDDLRGAWRVKNSFGPGWGEEGYAWIRYDAGRIGWAAAWVAAREPEGEDARIRESIRRLHRKLAEIWQDAR